MNFIILFHKEQCTVYKIYLIAPHNLAFTKILIDISYPTLDHVCYDCLYIIIIVT